MSKRVIFMHLPKCGGSTLHPTLRRLYNDQNLFSVDVTDNVDFNLDDLLNLSDEEKKNIKMVKGHVEYGIHQQFKDDSEYFTFLRNPVDRVISYYYYVKRKPNHRLRQENKFTDATTLVEFVENFDERDLNNGQIKFISGIKDTEENMLSKAITNIEKHFSVVGTVENFDESLLLLSKLYNWTDPFYYTRNKTKGRPKSESLDAETLEVIKEYNKGDIQLYEKYNQILQDKIDRDLTPISLIKFRKQNRKYNKKVKLKQKIGRLIGR